MEALNRLLLKASDLGLIRGAAIGDSLVSHLQFADDTMLFLEAIMDGVKAAKRILRCFELASRLKINFQKSCLVKVDKSERAPKDFASTFHYKKANFPIQYLGMPLGANPIILGTSYSENR